MHATNFEKVRDFTYFTKYTGKDEDAPLHSPIPGKWWGRFNAHNIPISAKLEVGLTPSELIHAQRIARKIRQKRMDEMKHRQTCRAVGLVDDQGSPTVSSFYLSVKAPRLRSIVPASTYHEIAAMNGHRFGRFVFDPTFRINECSVTLSGRTAPATVLRIIQHVQSREVDDFGDLPY